MNKTAAIIPMKLGQNFIEEIKQALLLFDVIGIPNVTELLNNRALYERLSNEFEFLVNEKLLFNPMEALTGLAMDKAGSDIIMNEVKLIQGIIDTPPLDFELYMETAARLAAFCLNRKPSESYYSIPLLKKLTTPHQITTTKTDVIKVLIEHVPVPDETTPWEAILDFKNNGDNKGRMAALRKWINNTFESNLTPAEISDEIEDLMYRYKKSLEIHKIKHRSGVLQSVVVGSAELAENVCKLRFSNIAKGLFSMSQAEADLMSLELTAPGHELAYIYQTQQKFQGK